ncbi:MAG: hypothetical protein RL291_1174 [Pseudomonadota bacterium]|jgi:glyoxylase-like metal-dependent hydrolase (beta-lactamase superfamily II)
MYRLPALLILASVFVPTISSAQQRMDGELTSTPVRGGVHVLVMPAAGNVAVSVGRDGVFIIDDQFAPMVPKIRAAIAKLTDQPVRYVLNSHWHGDHAGGNFEFGKQGTVIVAHDNVRTRMSTEQFNSFFRSKTPPAPREALPVITFSDRMTFHYNDDVVRVTHVPNAHTDGDSLFYFEKADVLHTGDVFILYGYPFIDLSSGGSTLGMLAALDRILETVGPQTLIIPGHGPVVQKDRVQSYRAMLSGSRDAVLKLMKAGKNLEAIVAAEPLAPYEAEWGKGFVKAEMFIKTLYDSEKAAQP